MVSRALLLACLSALAIVAPASTASAAEFGIAPGGFAVEMLDAEGNPESRAGSHPALLQLDFALEVEGTGTSPRELVFEMPAGFAGSPDAVPECSRQAYDEGQECPADTQVGVVKFNSSGGAPEVFPIFQLEPEPGQLFAFASKPGLEVPITMELRPSDYGMTLTASNPQQAQLSGGHLELWGIPADHQQETTIPRRPFLTTPTYCGPMVFTFRTRSWQENAPWLSANAETGLPLGGCEDLSFEPRLALRLDNPIADSPTGLQMNLDMPEEEEASERTSAQIKNVTVEFPPGVTVSPGGADQLTACSDAQFGLGSTTAALCPPSSRVGSMEISSPAIPESLPGDVFIGEEHQGERFRMLIAAPGPGVVLKFVGGLHPDPVTGRLSARLNGLPQVPMQRLSLNIDGGPKALLASPLACGPAIAASKFASYSGGAIVQSFASVAILGRTPGSPCPGAVPFAPELIANGSSPEAGRPTSFSAMLRRRPGEQLPRRFGVTLPPGLSASLGAVQPCSDAEAAMAACPASSRVGGALAEIGSGPVPATLRGNVYATGPYRRAPFGLLLEFRAVIGPFNLGTMALRAGAELNGRTGGTTVSVDRLPDVVEGVPVRFQAIELDLDRQGLVRNPTSCGAKNVDATIEAHSGAVATSASPLALRGCHRLGFKPHFRMTLEDRAGHVNGNPVLRVSVRQRPGDTNLRAMTLSFPPDLKLDTSALKEICSMRDASEGLCPGGSRVGSASARTPLMSRPLKGSIYIVQPPDDGLPELGVSLAAAGLRFALSGRTSSRDGHLITKLVELPDIPLSAFTMRLGEGNGAFSLDSGLCAEGRPRRLRAGIAARGQNGARRRIRSRIRTKTRCGASTGSRKHDPRRHAAGGR